MTSTDSVVQRTDLTAFRWTTVLGLTVGLAIFSDRAALLPEGWFFLASLGGPWLLLAFGAAASRSLPTAARPVVATLVIAVGLAAYTAFKAVLYGPGSVFHQVRDETVFWGLLTVACGAVSGAAAILVRSPHPVAPVLGWATVGGMALGEPFYWLTRDVWSVAAPSLVVASTLALAVLAFAVIRTRTPWVVPLAVIAGLAHLALLVLADIPAPG